MSSLGGQGSGVIADGEDNGVGRNVEDLAFFVADGNCSVLDLAESCFEVNGNGIGLKEIAEVA